MEQAVNLFNKGLLMDTHPMVLGNDTLSDALNATFVTMNGNEVVLQNDMGNRKIDNAFLPAGYEPVGMKEYGGVIYVAAYNPLTSRGLVGSFPSPQRKINTLNSASLLNFSEFLETVDEDVNIRVNNITVPISINEKGETITLHTGDKFSIYSNGIAGLLPYICPSTFLQHLKNNLFTFLIGLFNSLNEFIDITDKLKLWDLINNGTHYNYYINDSEVNDSNNGETDLIKARNCLDINTYSYKMASPLYLRAIINHVDNVSYSIIGDKVDVNSSTCNIYIEVTYTYNCIDTVNGEFFKIEFNGTPCTSVEQINNLNINPIYLPELDKYLLTLSYEVSNVNIGNSSTFDYTIKFPLLYDTNFNSNFGIESNSTTIYLKSLELSGTLNSTLFGTDTVNLKGYRYYYDLNNNTTTLNVSIESYPKKGSEYTVRPVIYKEVTIHNGQSNLDETVEKIDWVLPPLEGTPPGTGSYTIVFNHFQVIGTNIIEPSDTTEYYLEERKLYKIKFVKEQGILTDNINVPDPDPNPNPNNTWQGIYVTTPIFNGNYIGKESSATLSNGEYNYEIDKNAYIKSFYNIKKFILTPQIECTYNQRKSKVDTEVDGDIIYDRTTENGTIGTYNLEDSYTVNTIITPYIKINNLELYPKEIDNLLSIENVTINNLSRTINEEDVQKTGEIYKYSTGLRDLSRYNDLHPLDVITISEEYSSVNSKLNLMTSVSINNYIRGELVEKNISYNYKITSFWNYIRTRYYNPEQTKFSGISLPYASVDIVGSEPTIAMINNKFEGDISWGSNLELADRQNFGSTNAYPQDFINSALLSASENLLVLDINTENYISTCYPPAYGGKCRNDPFRRLWLKISEKEYTPIFSVYLTPDNDTIKAHMFDDYQSEHGEVNERFGFKNTCMHIPHYFAYTSDSGSFGAKIIDYSRTSKVNEFDITSEVIINLKVQIKRKVSNNFEFETENDRITDINLQLSFTEPNIVSNEKIFDEYDNLKNFKLNCILEHPTSAYYYNSDTVIEYKDSEGNDFDPLYVYYSKPETNSSNVDLGYIYNGGFVKSYKAKKFKTEKGDDFPELKPSNELYHASDGRPHPYINPIVYPSLNARQDFITREQTTADYYMNNFFHYAAYHKPSLVSGSGNYYYRIPPAEINMSNEYQYSVQLFLNLHDSSLNNIFDRHTMLQMNLDGSDDAWCIYLDTKNIFDFNYIRAYKLYYWERNGDPMLIEWVDADTALQN